MWYMATIVDGAAESKDLLQLPSELSRLDCENPLASLLWNRLEDVSKPDICKN